VSGIVFDISNIIILVGTILQVRKVIKDRSKLSGYSTSGALINFLGVLALQLGYVLDGYWSWVLAIPTEVYWFVVFLYTWRMRR
jgi:hypothetical protein